MNTANTAKKPVLQTSKKTHHGHSLSSTSLHANINLNVVQPAAAGRQSLKNEFLRETKTLPSSNPVRDPTPDSIASNERIPFKLIPQG